MKRVSTKAELKRALLEVDKMIEDDLTIILRKIALDAFRMLVRISAKDTGFLRSNWAIAVDSSPPHDKLRGSKKRGYGSAKTPVMTVKHNSVIVIYNNTEYALYLEHGTPRMRAQPMIEPTKMAISNQLAQVSKALSKKYYNV